MTTQELMAIINTRLAYDNGNPTSRSFLLYVSEAIKRLKAYEDADPAIQAKQVAIALDELDMEDL